MKNYTINYTWYNEIADKVKHGIPALIIEDTIKVEVDVDEETFLKVSKELGWM